MTYPTNFPKFDDMNMTDDTQRRTFEQSSSLHTQEEIQRYEDLKNDIKELKTQVEALVEIWNQARGAISLIKWMVGILGSVGTFILFIKDHLK